MVVRVYPGAKNPTHDISLSDGVQTWGLKLDGGPRAIQEVPQTPSTIQFTGGGTKFGDWEPGYSHAEQRTWFGGRGLDDFTLDPSRFRDSQATFTMIDGRAFPAPQWKFATGLRTTHENLPGDVGWQPLIGGDRYAAASFAVGGSSFDAQNARIWLRRIGSPGTLTVEIWTDSGGSPSALVTSASDSVDTDTVTDFISIFCAFDMSAAANLSASTTYWVVVYGASTDSAANHWEIGVDADGAGSKKSSDGSSWSAAAYSLYYRVEDSDTNRKWHFFEMYGALYAISQRADEANSELYMNGERGNSTGSNGVNTIIDTSAGSAGSWSNDQWNGWRIKIVGGTGKGQDREIVDSTSGGTLTVDRNWDATPDDTSDYVIYGGDAWQQINITIGGVVQSVAVQNRIAFLARGASTDTRVVRFNDSSADNHQTDTIQGFGAPSPVYVTLFVAAQDPTDGPILWVINGRDAQRISEISWGGTPTVKPDTAIKVGSGDYDVTNGLVLGGTLYLWKQDGLYSITSYKAQKEDDQLDFIKSPNNGEAALVQEGTLVFSWGGFSLQQRVGSSLQSIGPDRGEGLPDGRQGPVVALRGHSLGLFAAVDGGPNRTSSVLFRNDERLGWHEVFRGWDTGKRAQSLYWQDVPGGRPRLWIGVGGEIVVQEWPEGTFNPLEDSGMNFQHEAVIVAADVDFGVARLPKFVKELTILSENLTTGIEVNLEYQLDADIGGTTWTRAETFYSSPEDTLAIHRGDVRRIRYRLRMLTDDANVPPLLKAAVLEAFARTPVKYQWNMRVQVADSQLTYSGGRDHDPDAFTTWLKQSARQAKRIHMRSVWEQMDETFVIVEPPSLMRNFTNKVLGWWGGSQIVTIREA